MPRGVDRIFSLFFGIVLLTSGPLVAAPKSSASAHKEPQDAQHIELQIRENKSKIQQKKKEKLFAERNLGVLARELKFTELSLNKAKHDLESSVQREKAARQKLTTVRQQYSESSTQFSHRLRAIYQNQNLGFIEYLFTSKDLTSVVDSSYYFDRILSKDSDLIQTLRLKYAEVSREKSRVEQETQRIQGLKAEIGQKETDLTKKAEKQKVYIASLHAQIEEMERQNKELEKSSQEIAQAIRRLGRSSRGGEGYFGSGAFQRPVQAWISSYFGYRMHPIFRRSTISAFAPLSPLSILHIVS